MRGQICKPIDNKNDGLNIGTRRSELVFPLERPLLGLVETPQKIGEATRKAFFQNVAVISPEGITNPYSNGPTDVIFIGWHNFHV
jgi:hypothetical protein